MFDLLYIFIVFLMVIMIWSAVAIKYVLTRTRKRTDQAIIVFLAYQILKRFEK